MAELFRLSASEVAARIREGKHTNCKRYVDRAVVQVARLRDDISATVFC